MLTTASRDAQVRTPSLVATTVQSLQPFVVRCIRAEFAAVVGHDAADAVAREACDEIARKLSRPEYVDRNALRVAYEEIGNRATEIRQRRAGESESEVDRMLDGLPEHQRNVLLLRVVGGLSVEQSAEAIGTTPDAVRLHQHRALAELRKKQRR